MVDKPKKKSTKPKQGSQGVLGGLPAERPARIGTRNGAGAATTTRQSPKTTRKPRAASTGAASPTGAANSRAASTRAASPTGAAKPRAASTRRKAAAPRTFEPTEAAEAAAAKPRAPRTRTKAAAPRTFEPTQAAEAAAADAPPAEPKPRPVRAAVPKIGTSSERAQPPRGPERPSGTELVATAVQAAGELTQVGLSIGGQLIKRAFDRVPKP